MDVIVYISKISPLFACIACIILGLGVYLNNRSAKRHHLYLGFSFILSIWAFSCYVQSITTDNSTAFYADLLLYTGAAFAPTIFLDFISAFINKNRSRVIAASYFASVVFLAMNFTPFFRRGVVFLFGNRFVTDPNIGWYLYLIFFGVIVAIACSDLIYSILNSTGTRRSQSRYLLLGSAFLISGGGAYFVLILNLSVNMIKFPVDAILNLISSTVLIVYEAIISYAIVTTRFMDIEVIIRKSIAYASLSTFMAVMYFSTLYLSEYVFRRITGLSSLWVAIPLVTVFSLLIQPLRLRIQEFVDNMFFKARYDYQKILAKYTHALKRPTTDLDRFLKLAPYLIRKAMKLSGAGMLVLNRRQLRYELRAGEAAHRGLIGTTISDNHEIVKELLRTGEPLILDDVKQEIREGARDPAYAEASAGRQGLGGRDGESGKWERVKKEMSDLKATLLIPSISKSEYFKEPVLLAIFDFGGKLSEDSFSGSDIEFLQTIARQASIVIEYAFILEELRRDEQQIIGAEKFAALGTMAGSVVSALKGPIEDMETYSIEMAKKFDDKKFREGFTKDIPADINKLDRVVNDLLVYARPMKLNLSDVKLNDLVRKAVDLLRIKEMKEHVVVKESFTDGPSIQADPQQLLNALMRLFSYSIAAAKGEINVSTGPEDGHVVVNIEIPRSVIPREALAKIFTSYYSPKEGEGGLELATAAKIIREHNGDIKIESDPKTGTRIAAGLPV